MITFKQFLREEDEKLASVKDAAEVYAKLCGDWKDVRKPLWRFSSNLNEPMRLRTTRERQSKSRAGTADLQAWIFSQPGWEKFPKRSTSIFCSTVAESEIADPNPDESNVYAIYPVDGTKLAITKAFDFNFIAPFKSSNLKGTELSGLRYVINNIANSVEIQDKSIVEAWEKVKRTFLKDGKIDEDSEVWRQLPTYQKSLLQALLDELPEAFSPERMGCSLTTPAQLTLDRTQHEVWFDGKYLSIPKREFGAFCNAVEAQGKNENI